MGALESGVMLSPDRIVGVDEHVAAVVTVPILEADADGIHVGCLRILRNS